MKIKLDENLGSRGAQILSEAGHDVQTVAEEGLQAAPDHNLIDHCRHEERCLVTLDLGFANPLTFPPRGYHGIAVLRAKRTPARADLNALVMTLRDGLAAENIEGRLWIVEASRIRIHGHPPDDLDAP